MKQQAIAFGFNTMFAIIVMFLATIVLRYVGFVFDPQYTGVFECKTRPQERHFIEQTMSEIEMLLPIDCVVSKMQRVNG